MSAPTKRQLEALLMLYRGKSLYERDPKMAGMAYRSRTSSMGGATARMREAMGEAGWLTERTTAMGRTYYGDKLTLAGLEALAAKFPDLDGMPDRQAEAMAAEHAALIAEREADAEVRRQMRERAAARVIARRDAMRGLLEEYQVRHSLTDDQLVDLWLAVVEKEHDL